MEIIKQDFFFVFDQSQGLFFEKSSNMPEICQK